MKAGIETKPIEMGEKISPKFMKKSVNEYQIKPHREGQCRASSSMHTLTDLEFLVQPDDMATILIGEVEDEIL